MKMTIRRLKKAIKHPIGTIVELAGYERTAFIPDSLYLKIKFRFSIDRKLDLKNPKTYNEKLQWIKLYDRKDLYTCLVDKVKVRDYISSKIGDQYLIPSLGVWNSADEINFDLLPNQFVLKCNHNSGKGMCICKDKNNLDIEKVRRELSLGLAENYYYLGREWPYKNVQRRILGEQYMVDDSGEELRDYKVLCFSGEPKLIELHMGRFTDHQTQDIYDTNWKKTSITQNNLSQYKTSTTIQPKPSTLEEMLRLSSILSEGIPHVRVDWYSVHGQLYFGELTFFDGSGFDKWDKLEDDLLLGSWISLPPKQR